MREKLIERLFATNDISGVEKLTYYDLLGVRRDLDVTVFTQNVILRHQDLLRQLGPLYPGDSRHVQISMLINQAVNVLLDNDKRQRYDHLLKIYIGLQSPVKNPLFFVAPQNKNLNALCKDLNQLAITNRIITNDHANDTETPPKIGLSKL